MAVRERNEAGRVAGGRHHKAKAGTITMNDIQPRFPNRRRLMTVRRDAMQVAEAIRDNLAPDRATELRAILDGLHPADLADAMLFLSPEEEKVVFDLLDPSEAAVVL